MRKSIKKVAATLMAATMVLGAMSAAYADGDEAPQTADAEEITYSLVGSPELGTSWDPTAEDYFMTKVSENVYKYESTTTAAVTGEFKIVADGENSAWSQQFEYGTAQLHDNASQFKLPVEAGDALTFYANIATGEVIVVDNGADVSGSVEVMWDTRDEWKAEEGHDWCSLAEAKEKYVVSTDENYSVVGTSDLCTNWDIESALYWATENDGTFTKTLVATKDGEHEFKIVFDGVNNGWSQQFQYGVAGAGLGDNKSQFKVTAAAGDVFEVTFVPATGDVTVLKNGEVDKEVQVKWDTRDEWEGDWATLADAKIDYAFEGAEDVYSVVGTSDLIGLDWAADNGMYLVPQVDGKYTKVVVAAKDGDAFEFKIVKNGPDEAWANQLQLGVAEFGDNKSQFRVAGVKGDVFAITFDPATGDVNVTKNGEAYDYLVRWATRDEDEADFLSKADALAKFVNTAAPSDDKQSSSGTDEKQEKKDDDASGAKTQDPTKAADQSASTPTKANQAAKTGDAAPVAVFAALAMAVAFVAVAAKKKEA